MRSSLRPVEFYVLAALHREPLHGYGLVRRIEERTGGRVILRAGDLYRVLFRLSRHGLVARAGRHAAPAELDKRRTTYRITPEGVKVLRAEASLLARIAADVMAGRARKAPV